jgi:vWA found in TerF C terminus
MPVDLSKLPPELVDMRKHADVSIAKAGLTGSTAKVALCIDHSGSMDNLYSSGVVQAISEKILVLASAFDDDGDIDMFGFSTNGYELDSLDLSNYAGGIDRLFKHQAWGSTNYAGAMELVRKHYTEEKSIFPAYVLFVTDGEPDSEAAAISQLGASKSENIFWQMVGISGNLKVRKSDFRFLDSLARREHALDHVGFIALGAQSSGQPARHRLFGHRTPASSTTLFSLEDAALYDALVGSGYAAWRQQSA